jgi:ubiquitin-like 1-activating enzyme E1 B
VCASKPEVVLKVDTNHVTVKELRDEILKKNLNMHMLNPDVMLDGKGVIVISSEEGETECNESKLLKDLSIVDGCILKVDDFFQNYELTVTVLHISTKHDEPRFEIIADKDAIKPVEESKKTEEPQPGTSGISNGSKTNGSGSTDKVYESDDDDLVCIEVPSDANSRDVECTDDMDTQDSGVPASSAEKRKHVDLKTDLDDLPPTIKRARIQQDQEQEEDDDDVVCID